MIKSIVTLTFINVELDKTPHIPKDFTYGRRRGREVWIVGIERHIFLEFRQRRRLLSHTSLEYFDKKYASNLKHEANRVSTP